MELLQFLLNFIYDVLNNVDIRITIVLMTIALITAYSYSGTPKNLPPGPTGLPIVGYLPFLGRKPYEDFDLLASKYGPVFSLYFGSKLVVVLNNFDAIKEAFVKQADVFSGRPPLQLSVAEMDRYSVVMADGEEWKVLRRFTLNVLRDLGVGKLSIEPQIMDEIQHFITVLQKFNGAPTDFSEQLSFSVANNICILIFGKRFEYDDPWLIATKKCLDDSITAASSVGVMNFFPWLLKLPGIDKILSQGTLIESMNAFKESVYTRINEMKTRYIDGQRDNYINAFFSEKKKKDNNMFPVNALEENVRSLIAAGTETTANTLLWCILYMVNHPGVQKKVQQELDRVIGNERQPCWNDRLRTPYTEATICEVQRIATLLPVNLPHRNTSDCELFGYHIPKDTFILGNLWAIHNDDNLWENPGEFRPERFLSADNNILKKEYLIPFSMGKRECLGTALARMELYLYFSSLLQKFTFSSCDGCAANLEPKRGITYGPKC